MNRKSSTRNNSPEPWEQDCLAGSASDDAVLEFLESATECGDDRFCGGPYKPEVYYEPMFRFWLTKRGGFRHTRGDFTIFLEAAHRIMDIVNHEPTTLWAYDTRPPKPRRILGIFGPDSKAWNCLDPGNFEQLKFMFTMERIFSSEPLKTFWQ